MQSIEQRIDSLLTVPPYGLSPEEKGPRLLELLRDELDYAATRHAGFGNYIRSWPCDPRAASRVEQLPFLPVGIFKADPPVSLVEPKEVKRTLASSATTGQVPSKVVVDSPTARRMTKGVVAILQDFIGPARRPYLVVDAPATAANAHELGARGAAIQGLQPFANQVSYCLRLDDRRELELDLDSLTKFAQAHRGSAVLVYGFTYILWNHLVKPLTEQGLCLDLPNVHILHSGGWKRLQAQAVSKETFNRGLAGVFGCGVERVIDFYGLVENVGIIYPDCPAGNKHAPVFGEVVIRDPLTLAPVTEGGIGIIQLCSVLPTSFPGYSLLTEDLAKVIRFDGCPCGRRGISFRFAGRVPKAETRGCGNVQAPRQ